MRKELLFTALASVLMAGCSSNEGSTSLGSTNELNVSATTLGGSIASRSLVSAFNSGDQIGIFINGTGYTSLVATYTKAAEDPWISPASAANKIYLSEQAETVYGFYPASATATLDNAGTSTIAATVAASDLFNATGQADYMYATGASTDGGVTFPPVTVSNLTGANSATLVFHHALSKLSFVINRASTYSGTGTVTDIKLTSTDASNLFSTGTGTMKVSDGTLALGSTAADIEYTGTVTSNAYSSTASTTATAVQLVSPKSTTAGITLYLTVDGKVMSTTLPSTATAWAAGKNYIYTITVNGTELIVQSVSINAWTDSTGGSGTVN